MSLINFMQAYGDLIIPIFMFIVYVIACKFNNHRLKGVILKYLSEHSSKLLEKQSGQTYDNIVPVYRLNKITGELVKTDEVIDINEVVQSCKDQTLDYILDKFLPEQLNQMPISEQVISSLDDDLDTLRDLGNIADEYRERFNLSDSMSISDIYNYVNNERKKAVDALNDQKQKKEIVSDEEKKTVEEGK